MAGKKSSTTKTQASGAATTEPTAAKKGKLIRPRGKRGGIKHRKPAKDQQKEVQDAANKKVKEGKIANQQQKKQQKPSDAASADVPTKKEDQSDHAEKIAKFHTLLKQLEQATTASEKEEIQKGLDSLGGLAQYQAWSLSGSAKGGHTPTSKWCVETLNTLYTHPKDKPKFRVLDVGAITGTAYKKYKWIDATYIDLHPQGENVQKYSFFDYPVPKKEEAKFDLVALSLVINFVGDVRRRGEMLVHAHDYLRPEGFLYLVLPLQCLTNSRYMNQSHLRAILDSVGFSILKQSDSSKLSRWLLQRKPQGEDQWDGKPWKKREINAGPERNNFAIVLDPKTEEAGSK